jgi:hypothetical protein
VELKPRGFQGWASIIREGTPHGRTVAPHDFGFRVTPSFEAPFDGAYPTDTLLECFLRMPVRLVDGFRGFMEGMTGTELVRHLGSSMGYGAAHGELPIGDHSCHGHS